MRDQKLSPDLETEILQLFKPLLIRLRMSGYFPYKVRKPKDQTNTLKLTFSPLNGYLYTPLLVFLSATLFITLILNVRAIFDAEKLLGHMRAMCVILSVTLSLIVIMLLRVYAMAVPSGGLNVWKMNIRLLKTAQNKFSQNITITEAAKHIRTRINRRVWTYTIIGLVQILIVVVSNTSLMIEKEIITPKNIFLIASHGCYEILLFLHQGLSIAILGYISLFSAYFKMIGQQLNLILARFHPNENPMMRTFLKKYNFYQILGVPLVKPLIDIENCDINLNSQLESILEFYDDVESGVNKYNKACNLYFIFEFAFQIHFFMLKAFSIISLALNDRDEFWTEMAKSIVHVLIAMVVIFSFTSEATMLAETVSTVLTYLWVINDRLCTQIDACIEWKV